MQGPKEKWGPKGKVGAKFCFAPELAFLLSFSFLCLEIYHVCETVTLTYQCGKTYFNHKNSENLVS